MNRFVPKNNFSAQLIAVPPALISDSELLISSPFSVFHQQSKLNQGLMIQSRVSFLKDIN